MHSTHAFNGRPAAFARALAILLAMFFVLTAAPAYAAGRVTIKNLSPDEVDGKWKLNMSIDFGGAPDLPHVPMIFAFEMTTLYERALTDKTGDKPIIIRKPLSNQSAINESMDVGFSDPSGKIFPVTKFDFVIRRDRGFEAGEYTLKIKREGDGVAVGTPQKITLKGDNPVVDRRAIVFSGEKKQKKSEGEKAEGEKKDGDTSEAKATEPEAKPDPHETPPETTEAKGPPSEPPKQGGCGCRVAGSPTPTGLGALVLGMAVAGVLRRRRFRSRCDER